MAAGPRSRRDLVAAAARPGERRSLERFLAEKDTRLAERDEQIAALRRRVRALADIV